MPTNGFSDARQNRNSAPNGWPLSGPAGQDKAKYTLFTSKQHPGETTMPKANSAEPLCRASYPFYPSRLCAWQRFPCVLMNTFIEIMDKDRLGFPDVPEFTPHPSSEF
jgi:hypothetical protein